MAERRRTRLAREQRRELLVEAATQVFNGRDPSEVTFEQIADAAGVSRALVYNYFGDRQGVLEAVARRSADQLDSQVRDALSSTRGRRSALHEMVRVHLMFALTDPAGYRYAWGTLGPPVVLDLRDQILDEVSTALGSGTDGRIAASGVIGSLQEMVRRAIEDDGIEPERAIDVITAFLAGGLAALEELGVRVTPTWSVPGPALSAAPPAPD
jgi:AcrR family transcriptional regulator